MSEEERAEELVLKLNGLCASTRWAATASRLLKPLVDETDTTMNGDVLIRIFTDLSSAIEGRRMPNVILQDEQESHLFLQELSRLINEPEDTLRRQMSELFAGFADDFTEIKQEKQDAFTGKTVSVRFISVLVQSEMWGWIESEPQQGDIED